MEKKEKIVPPTPPRLIRDETTGHEYHRVGFLGEVRQNIVGEPTASDIWAYDLGWVRESVRGANGGRSAESSQSGQQGKHQIEEKQNQGESASQVAMKGNRASLLVADWD